MTKNQETIAVFACFTAIAVGDRAQKKLARAAKETTTTGPEHTPEPEPVSEGAPMSLPDPPELDSDNSDMEGEDAAGSTGVPPKMRRDPWLVGKSSFIICP
jgi:hypothetical protein